MQRLTVRVLSTDGNDEYLVEFKRADDRLSVTCTCGSGKYGKLCKHKMGLILADRTVELVNASASTIAEIADWLVHTDYVQLLAEYSAAKSRLDSTKSEFEKVKYRLERVMRDDEQS